MSTVPRKKRAAKRKSESPGKRNEESETSMNEIKTEKHFHLESEEVDSASAEKEVFKSRGLSARTGSPTSLSKSPLTCPYDFLKFSEPPLRTIIVPHFAVRSITFVLSMVYVVAFIVLIGYNYSKTQNQFTWNCSLFELQNKFGPRIRYSYELWRVPISAMFHSSIPHFCLNVLSLQLYGYAIEWYHGKVRYSIALACAAVLGHFLGCITNNYSVSTTPSAATFCVLSLKVWFFFRYSAYAPLNSRRVFLYSLFVLVVGVAILPVFVSNNVDFGTYIAGSLAGSLLGACFYFERDKPVRGDKSLSHGDRLKIVICPVVLACIIVSCIVYVFLEEDPEGSNLNEEIAGKCS